jgi:hypothetical protein
MFGQEKTETSYNTHKKPNVIEIHHTLLVFKDDAL